MVQNQTIAIHVTLRLVYSQIILILSPRDEILFGSIESLNNMKEDIRVYNPQNDFYYQIFYQSYALCA